jgi:NAD(P)-dependent dehydrogenase (short-subunit alcohol dehydrogenase family)
LNVAVKAPFLAAQAAIPQMLKRGGGSIVNVGSMWGLIAVGATPSSAYSAGKAGLHALTRNLAIEFCGNQIRVNAVAPAVVETPVYDTFLTPEQRSAILPTFNDFHPLGRNGQAIDIVNAILFLASDRASWITGTVLPVDGGVTSGLHQRF